MFCKGPYLLSTKTEKYNYKKKTNLSIKSISGRESRVSVHTRCLIVLLIVLFIYWFFALASPYSKHNVVNLILIVKLPEN